MGVVSQGHFREGCGGGWGLILLAQRVEERPYPGVCLCAAGQPGDTAPRWRRDIITFGTRCDTSNSYRE